MKQKQTWLYSPLVDGIFILSCPFLCLLAVILLPEYFQHQEVTLSTWIVLVLFIDVAHVYSTLFRTYLDKSSLQKYRQLLWLIPLLAWVLGAMLHSLDSMFFWRTLAYLAVFHFVRQQYGFVQLYARKEARTVWMRRIDTFSIYSATLYPLLYWHLEGNRNFSWFMEGDFWLIPLPELLPFLGVGYCFIILLYMAKEIYTVLWKRQFNLPRNVLIIGTYLSWYLGIVYFNGDLTFTLFNVVSHGIPYLALVWIYGRKKQQKQQGENADANFRIEKIMYTALGAMLFLTLIGALAYLEEGLWDALVWRERAGAFVLFQSLPHLTDRVLLSVIVPLLAVPQITHYITDGFIWKVSRDKQLKQ